jgi:flagellar assembly protein FliH
MTWRPAGTPPHAPEHASHHGQEHAPSRNPEPPSKSEPLGPGWEEFRTVETRLRDLEQQLPALEQKARQAGFKEGEAAAAAVWRHAIENASRSVAEMAGARSRMRRECEEDVVKLSLAMARRILRRELTVDREALLGLVKAALDRVDLRETHRVKVRPEDAPLVAAYLERIGSPHRVEVAADPALERGAVVFDTQRGQLDASIDTQLEEIERGFADLLRRPPDK